MSQQNDNFYVVDDFLPVEYFLPLKQFIESNEMPWFFMDGVAYEGDSKDVYFNHTFFKNNKVHSQLFSMIEPVIERLECSAIIRARANLYLAKKELIEHGAHKDFEFLHKTLLYYINTNNGFTRLEDGTKIESIANRALFFNGSNFHNSSNCTDVPHRINISISYF